MGCVFQSGQVSALCDLQGLDQVAVWGRYDLNNLAHVSRAGFALHSFCTTHHCDIHDLYDLYNLYVLAMLLVSNHHVVT